MDLVPIFHGLEGSALGTSVRQSLWLFPIIECFHLLSLALLGGTVLVVDMRLLGFGLRSQPSADLWRKVQPWLIGALAVSIGTGILMFLSEAIKCYYSPPFWYKMSFLALAAGFTFTAHRKVVQAELGRIPPIVVKVTALVSLLLWFGVGFSGRWIAFY